MLLVRFNSEKRQIVVLNNDHVKDWKRVDNEIKGNAEFLVWYQPKQ
jgi:hypothetical protein